MHPRVLVIPACALVVLAACGGGGDDGAVGAPAPTPTPGARIDAAKAGVPGYAFSAAILADSDAWRVRIVADADAGAPALSAVAVRIGGAYDPAATTVAAMPVDGAWEAIVTPPTPLSAGARVVVVATAADDSRLETGPDQLRLR